MQRLETSSHPMIQFRILGYRTVAEQRAKRLDETFCATQEGMRRYHIGQLYAHKPDEDGILYREEEVPGAHISESIMDKFRGSGFTKLDVFMRAEVHNCTQCNKFREETYD